MIVKHTPLSIAVIAGRTAWQSFHKGGKYEFPTNNITEDDYNFLKRLFNKYKHLSVAEHIWFIIKPVTDKVPEKIKNCNYSLVEKNEIALNLRSLFELYKDDNNVKFINGILNNSHPLLYNLFFDKEYIKEKQDCIKFSSKENEYSELLYELKSDNFSFKTFKIKNISRALLQEFVRHDDLLAITVKSTRYTLKELKDEKEFISININYDFDRAEKYLVFTENNMINKIAVKHLEDLRIILNSSISNDIAKFILPECYKTEFIVTLPERNFNNFLKLRDSKDALWEIQRLAKSMKEIVKN